MQDGSRDEGSSLGTKGRGGFGRGTIGEDDKSFSEGVVGFNVGKGNLVQKQDWASWLTKSGLTKEQDAEINRP
jgi:hypothetical protein